MLDSLFIAHIVFTPTIRASNNSLCSFLGRNNLNNSRCAARYLVFNFLIITRAPACVISSLSDSAGAWSFLGRPTGLFFVVAFRGRPGAV